MSGQGIGQILVYAASLIALVVPARALHGAGLQRRGLPARPAALARRIESGFLRLVRADAKREQDWKGYAKTVLDLQRGLLGASVRAPCGSRATCP